MAIECPRCGRQYDATLFQFGRTIHCACGARVGRDAQERRIPLDAEPRFVCDAMLGRTARWLRALGLDTAYEPDVGDAELVRRAIAESRVILTRDRRLPGEWRVGDCVVLDSEDPLEHVRRVVRRYGIAWPRKLFERCLACNAVLEPAPAREVEARAPPRVRAEHVEFRWCPECGRVYWPGSHARRMRRRLTDALGPVEPG